VAGVGGSVVGGVVGVERTGADEELLGELLLGKLVELLNADI